MDYDDAYSANLAYFGEAPDPILPRFIHLLDPTHPILDLGCGQGRNSLYLARRGFQIVAVDPSQVAVEQIQRIAADEELPMLAVHGGFDSFDSDFDAFDAVMSYGLIPDLPLPMAVALATRISELVTSDGTAWVTGFTTEDPAYQFHASEWDRLGDHSFRGPGGTIRSYLSPGGILDLFEGFEVVHHWEGLGPHHRHGDGPVERHGRFEAVFRKR